MLIIETLGNVMSSLVRRQWRLNKTSRFRKRPYFIIYYSELIEGDSEDPEYSNAWRLGFCETRRFIWRLN